MSRSFRVFATVFMNPDLRRLELAFIGFNTAEWATWVAILVYAYGVGGVTAAGLVALIMLVPSAVVAPLAAGLGDRLPRERVMMLAYLVQAAAMGATAAALLAGAPVSVVYVLAAAAAASVTLTRPAQGALLPWLARGPEELTAANVASGTIENLSILVGPAVTGLLLAIARPGFVFAIMTVVLLISAGLVARIEARPGRTPPQVDGGLRGLVGVSLGGFRTLYREPGPRLLIGLMGAQAVEWGALDVLIVVLAIELLGLGRPGVGFLNSAIGAGGLVGAATSVILVGRKRLSAPFGIGIVGWGLALAAVGIAPTRISAPLLLGVAGASRTLMEVSGTTLLQRLVDDEVLSRVFGVLEGIRMGALGVGAILVPAAVAWAGPRGAFVAAGLLLPAIALLAWRRLRRLDSLAVVPERELTLLRSVPMFAPLAAPVIERLASNLIREDVPAGRTVIRQGGPGDRFYIVAQGELEVIVDGRLVRVLGPGGSFGEIALLKDIPRTATVTARSQASVYGLERGVFLQAVTGHRVSAEVAHAVIRARLEGSGKPGGLGGRGRGRTDERHDVADGG